METQTLRLSSFQWSGMQLLNKRYWNITYCFYSRSCRNPQIWCCEIYSHLVILWKWLSTRPLIVTYIPDVNKTSQFSYLTSLITSDKVSLHLSSLAPFFPNSPLPPTSSGPSPLPYYKGCWFSCLGIVPDGSLYLCHLIHCHNIVNYLLLLPTFLPVV